MSSASAASQSTATAPSLIGAVQVTRRVASSFSLVSRKRTFAEPYTTGVNGTGPPGASGEKNCSTSGGTTGRAAAATGAAGFGAATAGAAPAATAVTRCPAESRLISSRPSGPRR